MCLRFVIYQYPTDDQPFVFLRWFIETFASVGRYGKIYRGRMENDGVVYDNKNIVLKVVFSTLKLHQGWPPGMWHNLCIIYIKNKRNLQMVLNGETIVDVIFDISAENPQINENIRKGVNHSKRIKVVTMMFVLESLGKEIRRTNFTKEV